jgi:ATP-dependent protease HslVU (ClpYQ) peptidase subunit
MTTVVVVRKDRQVCIAADTLARYGDQLEPARNIANSNKLVEVGDSILAPTGPASAQLVLRSYFSDEERECDFHGVDAIFETVRQMHAVLKDDFYLLPKEDDEQPFESSQMSFLVANRTGIYGVYSLRSVQEYLQFYSFGSGSEYALGALQALHAEPVDAESLARRAVEAACELDSATGAPVTWKTLDLA